MNGHSYFANWSADDGAYVATCYEAPGITARSYDREDVLEEVVFQVETKRLAGELWEVLRDPARPTWPGLLVVNTARNAFVQVAVGEPRNCADSAALATRIATFLNGGA